MTAEDHLLIPKDEARCLRDSMRVVREWLTTLSREQLDTHTLATIHSCISALSMQNNPRLAASSAAFAEIDKWAQVLVDCVSHEDTPMVYAAVLRRSADLIETHAASSKNGGYRGPSRKLK